MITNSHQCNKCGLIACECDKIGSSDNREIVSELCKQIAALKDENEHTTSKLRDCEAINEQHELLIYKQITHIKGLETLLSAVSSQFCGGDNEKWKTWVNEKEDSYGSYLKWRESLKND